MPRTKKKKNNKCHVMADLLRESLEQFAVVATCSVEATSISQVLIKSKNEIISLFIFFFLNLPSGNDVNAEKMFISVHIKCRIYAIAFVWSNEDEFKMECLIFHKFLFMVNLVILLLYSVLLYKVLDLKQFMLNAINSPPFQTTILSTH